MRVLLVEDDRMIAEGVRKGLRGEGWAVDWVGDGAAALDALALVGESHSYDLMLLDLGLPKRDGLEVLRALRGKGNGIPVLILTARRSTSTNSARACALCCGGVPVAARH